jgi:hypothetical protein
MYLAAQEDWLKPVETVPRLGSGRGRRLLIITKEPPARVAAAIAAGTLRCPCSGRLRLWGYARSRWIRDRSRSKRLRPHRGRCLICLHTHVILPDWVLLRRLDRVEVIGAALTASARGRSFRTISGELALPPTTVRDWIRRFITRTAAHPSDRGPAGAGPSSLTLSALVTAVVEPSSSPGRLWRDASRASCGQLLA